MFYEAAPSHANAAIRKARVRMRGMRLKGGTGTRSASKKSQAKSDSPERSDAGIASRISGEATECRGESACGVMP